MAAQIEVYQREIAVERMILSGMDSRKIAPKITAEWNLSDRQCRLYVARALERIRKSVQYDRPLEIAKANDRFEKVYREAMRPRQIAKPIKLKRYSADNKPIDEEIEIVMCDIPPNLPAAVAAEKARTELLGLNAPKEVKATITHTFSGKPLAEFKTEAELDALEAGIAEGKYLVQNGVVIDAVFEDLPKDESGEFEA